MYGNLNKQAVIRDFILTQTGTYKEQAIRPFVTNIRSEHSQQLEAATQGGRNLGPGALQGLAGDIIRPDAMIEGIANISEGWASRRFRFLMRVEEVHPFSPAERTQRVYFGYTDQCDASINFLDPNMRIYFNSETTVRDITRPTPNGLVVETMIVGSHQIISPIDMAGNDHIHSAYYTKPTTFMLRPEDIFNTGQTMHIADKMKSTGMVENIDIAYDARAMVGQNGGYKYSRRRDTIPSRYLSGTLLAYEHAVQESKLSGEFDMGMDREVLYGEAQTQVMNQDIGGNAFFALLRDHAGFMERGYITFQDLINTCPEADPRNGVTKYAMDNGRSIRQVNRAEDSEHWRGSDQITIAAFTLAQIVPAIMMDNYIRSISFAATNGQGGIGSFAIEIHVQTLRGVVDNLQLGPHLGEFERRLIFDALAPLTHNNQLGFQISMASDLAGDSVIDIAIGNEPLRRYVAPTFTDSLYTPVITQQHKRQTDIASDLLFMLTNAMPVANGPAMAYSQPAVSGRPVYVPPYPRNIQNSDSPQSLQGTRNDEYSGLL